MTGFNHVLTGMVLAVTIQQPLLAPVAALCSHFIADALPHFGGVEWFESWGKRMLALVIIDGVLSLIFLAVGFALFPEHRVLLAVCAAAATAPDWLWLLYYKFGARHKFFDWHQAIQRYERPWGAYVELCVAVTLGASLWFLH